MNYSELLKKVPEDLKSISEFRTAGVKPTGKLALGFGLANTVGEEAAKFGVGKALIVTDKTIVKYNLHKVCLDSMIKAGFNVDVFDEVDPEPHMENAQKVQLQVRKENYKVVVGIGGGSPMDMAKVAALMARNPGDIQEYMEGKTILVEGLPLILLPTTSGTGSEVSPYVVISTADKKLFIGYPHDYATVALIDPLLTVTAPPKVTASTGMDALSHAVEGFEGRPNPLTETFTNRCVEFVFKYLDRACKDPEDLEARYYMSYAAAFGMMSYTQGGGLYAHSMSYILAIHNNVTHGLGCGVTLPYTLMFNFDFIKDKLARFMKLINPGVEGSEEELAKKLIDSLIKLLEQIDLPISLKGLGITEDQLKIFADELVNKYYRTKNPRPMVIDEAERLVYSMWEGKLTKI